MSRGLRTCAACGVLFAGTVRARYCSRACKRRVYYQQHVAWERARQRNTAAAAGRPTATARPASLEEPPG